MKTFFTLFAIFFLSLNSFTQQSKEITIFKTDNTQIIALGTFIYENDLIKAIHFKSVPSGLNSNNLENVQKVIEGENVYLIKDYNGKKYLIQQISNGVLSLYKGRKSYYLENTEYGLRILPKNENTYNTAFKSGTVSVFINNCKPAVNELSKNASNLTLQDLKNLINTYNSCSLQDDIQVSDKVVTESMRPEEKIEFGVFVGFLNLNTDYSQIINASSTNIGMASFGVKVYFHTNFLNNNLDFNISADYFAPAKQQIIGSEYTLQSETQFITCMVEMNYVLNQVSTTFKPYFGVSGGILFDKSYVKLRPITSGQEENYNGLNEFTYTINVGTVINVFNQKFDFLIALQPSLNRRIRKTAGINFDDSNYTTKGINFKLAYIF